MTKLLVASIGIFLALAACSDDSGGSGGGAGSGSGKGGSGPAGGNCVARCEAVQQDCGADPTTCGQICAQISDAQLACVEASNCDSAKSAACFQSGSGGTGGSGGSGGSGGGASGGKGGSDASSCSLFNFENTENCPLSPCMTTNTGVNYCYGQAAKESECDKIGEAKTAFVAGSSRILCVPAGCPAPDTYVP